MTTTLLGGAGYFRAKARLAAKRAANAIFYVGASEVAASRQVFRRAARKARKADLARQKKAAIKARRSQKKA